MKSERTWMLSLALASFMNAAQATLQLVPNTEPVNVFAGKAQSIHVMFNNAENQDFEGDIRTLIYQSSSTTVVPLAEATWKRLHVLSGQTILETAQLNFPAVKTKTKFLAQWLENSNHVIGTTEVWVYPTNLLTELNPLLDQATLGVLDPDNELKPLLKRNGVKFVDLEETVLENFSGRLAIIEPFSAKEHALSDLPKQIKKLAKNVPVVWVQPPPKAQNKPVPSFYLVQVNTNAVVVVQSNMVSNLPDNPRSQLNLIYFCKLALHPQPPVLPDESAEP